MIRCLLLVSLLIHSTLAQRPVNKPVPNPVQKAPSKTWLTLNGDRPLVIARGGFSGLFPESSQFANKLGMATSLPDMVLYCNLQLSKDGYGICQSELRLDNSTNISLIYPKGQKTHIVNGQDLQGWFAMDFTTDELFKNVTLTQSIFSRPSLFDGQMPLSAVEDAQGMKPSKFWLNVPYDELYIQNKIIPATFVQKAMMGGIHFISSPEIGFLKVMNGRINKARTKLILKFPEVDGVEPTTKQKYSSILKDFNAIKAYASGILVPKGYIWPVNKDLYLQPPTTLVTDAHKQGLEVYAYGFANDMPASYNYSYDPRNEYLQFVDNSNFAVDGVLTDFPPTASEAIACFTQNKNETKPKKGKALIISKDGASGVYAGSTDLAYQQAIEDGADIIDCSVQMSKDGVAFCLSAADLMGSTTAVTTFMTRSATIPEIQNGSGIFSFDLTWSEIQTLKPQLANPIPNSDLKRNPAYKNAGKFMTLQEFLELAKVKAVTGILINIENAAYLASKKGLSITDAVSTALSNATFDKQATQQVLIQSDDTSVLSIFKNVPAYKRVLSIKEVISDVPKETVDEIKKYADAVSVPKGSLVVISGYFTSSFTKVVEKLHAANISVYVSVLRNEFVTLPFDFFSDPVVALHTYIEGLGVNGVVTDYPATAKAYTLSPCSDLKGNVPYNIPLSEAGSLLGLAPPDALPPAEGPAPALNAASVVDPPLPPVTNFSPPGPSGQSSSPAPSGTPPSSGLANTANMGLSLVVIMVLSLLSMGY